ncbi:MAG: ABC transporter permease [Xanthobacteraceae bacterium]
MHDISSLIRRNGYVLLLLPAVALVVTLFVIPLGGIVHTSFADSAGWTTSHFRKVFTTPIYLRIIWNTIEVALLVTFFCAIIGYAAAYVINELSGTRKNVAMLLVILPFWTSILIRTFSWSVLLGQEGLINTLLVQIGIIDQPMRMLYNRTAVTIAMVQILSPIVILTCVANMSKIDDTLIRAARLFGASPWNAFRTVFFPLSLSGLINGSILVFILCMGFFITPALLGGPRDLLIANMIEQQIDQMLNWGLGAALAVIVLLITLAAVIILQLSTRNKYLDEQR